jgi:hypothetical protein
MGILENLIKIPRVIGNFIGFAYSAIGLSAPLILEQIVYFMSSIALFF